MQIFISPAKSLDFDSAISLGESTSPFFISEATKVNSGIKKKSRKALGELQGISKQLAELNFHRNQNWVDETEDVAQAVMAFKGDVYLGMEAEKWSNEDMSFANEHLFILSGLYGLLRSSDLIKPYRLEMGTSLKIGRRANLYKFWSDKIAKYFKENIDSNELLVNLASQEYFKAIEQSKVKNKVLNIEFKDFSNGVYKVIGFFAKKARGSMANYIIQNRITSPREIRSFTINGYYFDESSSNELHYIFLRESQEN